MYFLQTDQQTLRRSCTNNQRIRFVWLSRCVKVSRVIYQYLQPHRGVRAPAAADDKRGQPVDCSHTQTTLAGDVLCVWL